MKFKVIFCRFEYWLQIYQIGKRMNFGIIKKTRLAPLSWEPKNTLVKKSLL